MIVPFNTNSSKKNLGILYSLGLFFFLVSCSNIGFNQTKSGLSYKIFSKGSKKKAQIGDYLIVDLVTKNGKDSVLESTYTNKHSRKFVVQKPSSIRDFNELMLLLSEQDSAVARIPADSLFKGGMPFPKEIKPHSYMTFQIKVQRVIPQNQLQAYLAKEKQDASAAESVSMDKYIKEKNLSLVTTPAGLRYSISQKGTGPNPVVGDTVAVNYTGRLLNGKIFDTNNEAVAKENKIFNMQRKMQGGYAPIRFSVGSGQVIKGWDDGLLLLQKGSKAIFIIPSSLAYGERGAGQDIGPFSPLTFDVELINIIKPKVSALPPPPPGFPAPAKGK